MRHLTENNMRLLKLNEGFRGRPYKDTIGKWTIGYGRNLTDVPLTEDEGVFLSARILFRMQEELFRRWPWVETLDPARYAVMLDLAYNLGMVGLSRFRKFLAAMELGDYEEAVVQLQASKWWRQVGVRGPRLAKMLETGLWPW